jgi:flap endonuclease-1
VVTDYDLKFRNPKREKLVDFLCGDHDFTEERTFAAIDKLVHETAQTSLEQWF